MTGKKRRKYNYPITYSFTFKSLENLNSFNRNNLSKRILPQKRYVTLYFTCTMLL